MSNHAPIDSHLWAVTDRRLRQGLTDIAKAEVISQGRPDAFAGLAEAITGCEGQYASQEAKLKGTLAGRSGGKSWVPGHLRILLHVYVTTEPFPMPERSSEFYRDTVGLLLESNLIEYRDGIARTTKRGEAFVQMLLQTPMPDEVYVDPRTAKAVL